MSRWSSFERDKRHADAWRKYICEGRKIEVELEEGVLDSVKGAIDTVKVKATDATRSAKSAAGYEVDSVGPDPGAKAGEAEPDAEFAGISSEVYPDSLNNMLKPRVSDGTITDEQKKQIVLKMVALTREEGIVLEALGDDPNPRSYSSKATGELSQLIDSFELSPEARQKLEKTLNKWAKMNTVKFEKPAATGRPVDSDAAGADAESDEEPGVVKQTGAAGKLGKFGPLAAKLAPAIKAASKAKAVQGGKETLQIALDKAGIDADVEEIQKATKTAVAMYDKLADIPGVGEELSKTMGSYVEPLRSVANAGTAEDSGEKEPEEVEPIDLSDEVELLRRSQDPRDPPFPPPEGYDIREFNDIPAVFISMVNNTGGEILNNASAEGEYKNYDFTDGWGLYATTTSSEPRNAIYNPKVTDLDGTQGVGLWVPDWMNAADLTDLPIRESLLERWQVLAGIKKRVL